MFSIIITIIINLQVTLHQFVIITIDARSLSIALRCISVPFNRPYYTNKHFCCCYRYPLKHHHLNDEHITNYSQLIQLENSLDSILNLIRQNSFFITRSLVLRKIDPISPTTIPIKFFIRKK